MSLEAAVATAPAGSGRLARVDALAAGVLARLAPLTFGVARSPLQIEAVYRLRFAVVMDQGWGRAEDFPDGLERDTFDAGAIQICAWDGHDLVGTTRLVPPGPEGLPTDQLFGLALACRGAVIDMGRTCRAPWRRESGQRIVRGLICRRGSRRARTGSPSCAASSRRQ